MASTLEDLAEETQQQTATEHSTKSSPEQRLSEEAFRSGIKVLSTYYNWRPTEADIRLWRRGMALLTDEEFIAALDAHIQDPTENDNGRLRSAFIPKIGEIRRHAQMQARNRYQRGQNEKYRQDKSTRAADSRALGAIYSNDTVKAEMARGKEIRNALVAAFNLNLATQDGNYILMQTLKAVQGQKGLGTVEEALVAAEQIRYKTKAQHKPVDA